MHKSFALGHTLKIGKWRWLTAAVVLASSYHKSVWNIVKPSASESALKLILQSTSLN